VEGTLRGGRVPILFHCCNDGVALQDMTSCQWVTGHRYTSNAHALPVVKRLSVDQ